MEFIIGAGLLLGGLILNSNQDELERTESNELLYPLGTIDLNQNQYVKSFPKNYLNNYKSDIYTDSNEFVYDNISDLYKKSLEPNSNIVNNIWRITNDPATKFKEIKINNILNKDINLIKKTYNNNIEPMKNIYSHSNNYDSDSDFSDN